MNISSIGLGKLGLCSAACFASKGHHVIGVDSDERHIDALAGGGCPIDETGLSSLLAQCRQPRRHHGCGGQKGNDSFQCVDLQFIGVVWAERAEQVKVQV